MEVENMKNRIENNGLNVLEHALSIRCRPTRQYCRPFSSLHSLTHVRIFFLFFQFSMFLHTSFLFLRGFLGLSGSSSSFHHFLRLFHFLLVFSFLCFLFCSFLFSLVFLFFYCEDRPAALPRLIDIQRRLQRCTSQNQSEKQASTLTFQEPVSRGVHFFFSLHLHQSHSSDRTYKGESENYDCMDEQIGTQNQHACTLTVHVRGQLEGWIC